MMNLVQLEPIKGIFRKNQTHYSMDRIYKINRAALLQRRAWQQALPVGTDAKNFHPAKRLYPCGYGGYE